MLAILGIIYREFCKARLTECARWLAIEHADGESKRRIFHGHTNGTRDLGDDWSPAVAHETGHQTEVCRNVWKFTFFSFAPQRFS